MACRLGPYIQKCSNENIRNTFLIVIKYNKWFSRRRYQKTFKIYMSPDLNPLAH